MIVLDSNVVSEMMRSEPAPQVAAWASHLEDTAVVTVVTLAEVTRGILRLPQGQRRRALAASWESARRRWAFPALPFDEHAAVVWAEILAAREAGGQPMSVLDAQVAAICVAQGLPLATRNTKDFVGVGGLTLIDPWAGP